VWQLNGRAIIRGDGQTAKRLMHGHMATLARFFMSAIRG
jgi:hypothetical protein